VNECVEIWGNLVDWIYGPAKLFLQSYVDWSGNRWNPNSLVYIYTWEWMNKCIMWRQVVSCHFSCLLQQHNTDFFDLSIGLIYAVTAGKEGGAGQDATFHGRSSSSFWTLWPLVPTRAIGVMQRWHWPDLRCQEHMNMMHPWHEHGGWMCFVVYPRGHNIYTSIS
jgi:hypothetical protein